MVRVRRILPLCLPLLLGLALLGGCSASGRAPGRPSPYPPSALGNVNRAIQIVGNRLGANNCKGDNTGNLVSCDLWFYPETERLSFRFTPAGLSVALFRWRQSNPRILGVLEGTLADLGVVPADGVARQVMGIDAAMPSAGTSPGPSNVSVASADCRGAMAAAAAEDGSQFSERMLCGAAILADSAGDGR